MLSERFFRILKANVNDLMDRVDNINFSKIGQDFDKFLDSIFPDPDERRRFEEKYSSQKQKEQDEWDRKYNYYQQKSRNQQNSYQDYFKNQYQSFYNNFSAGYDYKYYDALEIKPGASFDEIKAGYKKVMKKYHPDKYHSDPEKYKYAQQISQKINEAYAYFKKKHGQS